VFVITRSVQNSHHHHYMFCFQNLVDYAIGKSLWVTPPDILSSISAGIEQGVFRQFIPHLDDFLHKLHPKSRLLLIIPARGRGHVRFDVRPDLHAPVHFLNCERRRAFMISNGRAEPGFLRCAASLSSIKAWSAGGSPGSSKSRARQISNCRWLKVSNGSSCKTSAKLMPKFNLFQPSVKRIIFHFLFSAAPKLSPMA